MRKLGIIFLLFLAAFSANAQDTHFSQFFFSPQWLGPAEIGHFDAQYRGVANQKTQWREVAQPYTTFALGIDGRPDFLPENVAAGLAVMNDRAGDSRFNTFSLLLGGSYTHALRGNEQHLLRGGLQAGITQVSIDPNALRWDRQFNGVAFDPNLPTGENIARNTRWHPNLHMGLSYTHLHGDGKVFTLGYAGHNLGRPDRSFYNDTGVDLPLRNSVYLTATWPLSAELDLLPSLRYMRQATFGEFMLGTSFRYTLLNERSLYRAIFAGYYGRIGDAGIGMLGMEIDDWRAALSYDINVSSLQVASRNRGGFEFSLQYLFNREPRNLGYQHKFCPVYL